MPYRDATQCSQFYQGWRGAHFHQPLVDAAQLVGSQSSLQTVFADRSAMTEQLDLDLGRNRLRQYLAGETRLSELFRQLQEQTLYLAVAHVETGQEVLFRQRRRPVIKQLE